MANPFTSFAFPASGAGVNTNITLPIRLAYIKNVKDFGAKGDGVTDDWPAITAAFNFNISATEPGSDRGTIYFPPGTYLVSQPIIFDVPPSGDNITVIFRGELGLSIITGNFADYIFSRTVGFGLQTFFEKLTITNTNALGGGIRLGGNVVEGAVRDCVITANKGVNTYNSDTDPSFAGSFGITFENCMFSPGSNRTSSQGLMLASNGPVLNCYFKGFDTSAIQMARGAQAQYIGGCFFEQNGTAILFGVRPDGTVSSANNVAVAGCWFKNNSTAISFAGNGTSAGSGADNVFIGLRIEGTNGQAPGSANPQYGIILGTSGSGTGPSFGVFAGIVVTGQYDIAGISIPGSGGGGGNMTFMGVSVTNSSTTPGAVPWALNTLNHTDEGDIYIACNQNNVITVANLPTEAEGAVYNVSDGTNSLAWGATVTNTGTHTTHYKVRGNGSNWTVMGQ